MALRPINANELLRLYEPVGQIVVLWGYTDSTISMIGFLMMKVMKTPDAAHNWPLGFGKRLSIIETNLEKRLEFAELKRDGLALIKVIREMQKLRDMLIHGNPYRYDPPVDSIIFHRVDRLTEKQKKRTKSPLQSHHVRRMSVRFATLEDAADRCILINSRLNLIRDHLRAI